jgi:hypothetical protein
MGFEALQFLKKHFGIALRLAGSPMRNKRSSENENFRPPAVRIRRNDSRFTSPWNEHHFAYEDIPRILHSVSITWIFRRITSEHTAVIAACGIHEYDEPDSGPS